MKVKPDISTLLKTGHFYFALTSLYPHLNHHSLCDISQRVTAGGQNESYKAEGFLVVSKRQITLL